MNHRVVVRVLGPTGIAMDGRPVTLGSTRQRRLLAALALEAGAVVMADRLADRVWATGQVPDNPRRALRTNLARLRRALGPDEIVVTENGGWRFDTDAADVDARQFDALVEQAADPAMDVHRRLLLLDEALRLWRGAAYDEVADEEWARAEAARLNELRLGTIEQRFEAMLATGLHADALPAIVGAAETHPFRDRLIGLQMIALYRSGRQAEAGRVFQAHRARLSDQLGLDPGPELVELDRQILTGEKSLALEAQAGRPLRGYRLGEQLGEGAFAVVHRGTQPSLGRDVAIKIIRSDLANRPEFIRRFETEAFLVARLEHPYIVPLYDFWREPDRAYLVFRYLRGGTLEARVTSLGGLPLEEARSLVVQVGAALRMAHEVGVVHRDVKPANIFLDEAGNFFLGDFGIALDAADHADPMAALSAGSPAYASPEQLRRELVGPAADVHGLGISLFEALTGRLPFPGAQTHAQLLQHQLYDEIPSASRLRADVPAEVDAILAKATAKNPDERYGSIDQLVADFESATRDVAKGHDRRSGPRRSARPTLVSAEESRNPYKGLRAFTEADAGDFYGRERAIEQLTELLARTDTSGRIVVVVGPSGIGKSSLVRAGLLPAIHQDSIPGSSQWFVATMMPGAAPFEELAAALLRVATRVPDNLMSQLTEDTRGLTRVAKAVVPDGGTLLLIIDQFEELFTLSDDANEVRRFLESIEHAMLDARCPLKIVPTLRADFWDRPLRHSSFARLIGQSTVNLTALAPDELDRAITEPAHRAGCEFEPGLIAEIVADVSDQPGALPLLQYALTELWDEQVSGLLTRDAYAKLNGVAGALTRRAEELFTDAPPVDQRAIRHLFERLVTPGQGTEDTRRRIPRSEVAAGEAADEIIARFGRARLLSFDIDPGTREPTIEVAHEALIRQWPRLRAWLDEDRDGLRILRHLSEATREWDESERDPGELYRGARLQTASQWAPRNRAKLNHAEQAFLSASEEKAADDANAVRRHQLRLRRLAIVAAVVAVIAVATGAVALGLQRQAEMARADAQALADAAVDARADAQQSADDAAQEAQRADAQAFRSEVRRLVAESANQIDIDRRLALLMAVEAHRLSPGPLTLGALQRVMLQSPQNWLGTLVGPEPYVAGAFVGSDEIAAIADERLDIWRVADRALLTSLHMEAKAVSFAASGDGALLGIGYEDGPWEIRRGDDIESIIAQGIVDDGPVRALALSPSGSRIAIGAQTDLGGVVQLADVANPGVVMAVERPLQIVDLAFSPDDTLLAVGIGATAPVIVLDATTGTQVGQDLVVDTEEPRFPGGETIAWADNRHLIVGGATQMAAFDARTGAVTNAKLPTTTTHGFGSGVFAAGRAYLLGDNGIVEQYDPETRSLTWVAQDLQVGTNTRLAVTADGSLLAIITTTGISLLSTDGRGTLAVAEVDPDVEPPRVVSAELTEDGTTLMTANPQRGPVLVWDVAQPPALSEELPFHKALIRDDMLVLVGPGDGDSAFSRALWQAGELASFSVPQTSDQPFGTAVVDADGQTVVVSAGFSDGAVLVIDIATDTVVANLGALRDSGPYERTFRFAPDLEFRPDGKTLIVTTRSGAVYSYDTATWQQIGEPIPPEAGFHGITFSADGTIAVTVNWDEELIELRDPATLEVRRSAAATNLLAIGGESPDILRGDRYFVTSGSAGGATLWDIDELVAVGEPFPHTTDFRQAGVANEVRLLATTTDNRVVLWNLDTDSWPTIACRAAGRNFSPQEWDDFGPSFESHRRTCDEWPLVESS